MSARKAQFLGLDLTSSSRKPSAYALLDASLKIIALSSLSSDRDIRDTVDKTKPLVVAIDAPLSLPLGLCCLQQSCSCTEVLPGKGRACERELAWFGIPCYFTTKMSILEDMVERAIPLKDEICRRGYQVIEVYPYATKVRLWGKPIPRKTTREGLEFLREQLAELIPGLERESVKAHDLGDALIAGLYRSPIPSRAGSAPGPSRGGAYLHPATHQRLTFAPGFGHGRWL